MAKSKKEMIPVIKDVPAPEALPAISYERRVELVGKWIEATRMAAENSLEVFKEELTKNPMHALEWGDAGVKAGVRLTILKELEKFLKGGAELTALVKHCHSTALHMARHPSMSSSAMSNVCYGFKMATYVEFAERLDGYVTM